MKVLAALAILLISLSDQKNIFGEEMKTFSANRRIFTYTMNIKSTPDKIFPLLCPVREYEWLPSWDCKLIYSKSGVAEKDCVFITHFPGIGKETWHVYDYVKNKNICFIRVTDDKTTRHDIVLNANHDKSVTILWTETCTSLTDNGNLQLERITEDDFSNHIRIIESELKYFLETGKMMTR